MNKAEIINAMAESADITKIQAQKALDAVLDSITGALKNEEKVTLVNFGTFFIAGRSARAGRNPRTNESIEIPAKRVAKFKPGKMLSDAV